MSKWVKDACPGLWYHKIADPRTAGEDGTHFITNRRAVDVVCSHPDSGRMVGLEWKIVKGGLSIPKKKVKDHQIETLEKIIGTGGIGLLMIAHLTDSEEYARVYAIPPKIWRVAAEATDKKSVRLDSFNMLKLEITRHDKRVVVPFKRLYEIMELDFE
jgi:penicillin-binding protein-related factor A (putative recombinase)